MQKTVCEKTVNSESETVHIILTCQLIVWLVVPLKLCVHIQHGSNRQQIQFADMDAQLHTPQQQERRCHFK